MADNLLDREKAYRAVVIPSVGNVRADRVLRSLQDALNRTGFPLMHQKFRNVTRKEPIDVSGNPYYDSVMDVVRYVMDKFRISDKVSRIKSLKNGMPLVENSGDVRIPMGDDGIYLNNVFDANYIRHSITNYDELRNMFKDLMEEQFSPLYGDEKDFLEINPPNTIMNAKGNRLVPNWNFYLLDNNGMKRNAYDLFRQSFDDRINEYIPSYNRALRTNPFETPEIYEGLDNAR